MSLALECDWDMQNDFGRNNFTDRQGASELKARIEEYWRKRGFEVQVILVEAPFSPAVRAARVDVRSDLVNGWPRANTAVKERETPVEPLRN
jgi:hypothetical protein